MIYRTRGEHANTTDAVDITKKNVTLSKKIKIKFSKIYYSMNHNNFLPLKLKIYPISGIAIKTFFTQKRHFKSNIKLDQDLLTEFTLNCTT